MKKLIFCSLLFLFMFVAPSSLLADEYQDVVYLMNGSVIHGIVIEEIPDESIKIETKDGNVFVFTMDEILKITKEKVGGEIEGPVIEVFEKKEGPQKFDRKGFMISTGVRVPIVFHGGYEGTEVYVSIPFGFGYGTGLVYIGFTVEYPIPYGFGFGFTPRFYFTPENTVSIFAYTGVGYWATWKEYVYTEFYHGLMFGGGAGVDFAVHPKAGIYFCGGFLGDQEFGWGFSPGIDIQAGITYYGF